MNRRVIVYIIISSSVALITLAGMQMYWIRNAIQIREANFKRSVTEAINSVIYTLEKTEMVYRLDNNPRFKNRRQNLFERFDSLSNRLMRQIEKDNRRMLVRKDTVIETREGKVSIRLTHSATKTKAEFSKLETDSLDQEENKSSIIELKPSSADSLIQHADAIRQSEMEQFMRRTFIANEIFTDLLNFNPFRSIERRINVQLLDSLIQAELEHRGITTAYEFGIYSPFRNELLMQKTGDYSRQLLEDGLAFNLNPGDVFGHPEFLLLYFPNEKKFLLRQMSNMLIVSFVLILGLIFLFSYTITSLVKQKKLSEMKSDFINNMTHEFKTPISTVSLACEALSDKSLPNSPELFENYIQIIKEENHRLGTMAEKILQTAQLEKGQLKLHFEPVDIHEIIHSLAANMQLQVEKRGGRIFNELNATSTVVEGDRSHLIGVINNLLDNANKYSPEIPEIWVKTENTENGILISIKDNGIGISKANQKKIFDKLFRVSTGNLHDVKGFGLGLSYAKDIVEMHGGNILLESELGKGSVFTVYLPFFVKTKN